MVRGILIIALGLISNQLVINIGPDPRLPPPPADSGRPVFIRFGPSPPPNPARSQPKVPTIPVTVRFTQPRRTRQQRRPPTPIDVPIPMVPEISPGTIPKTGADLLTPHPTVIPSPFMGTVITSEASRTPKPTIIRLPNFNSPPQREGIDALRAPAFVRATARMPYPARPDKEKTVIRVPDEPPPTPIIVRIQSPLGSPRIAQQGLPARSVTLHVRAPEPGVRSPSRVFARLKNERSVGNDVESNNG